MMVTLLFIFFFFSSRRRHTRSLCDWSSDVCFPISIVRPELRRMLVRQLAELDDVGAAADRAELPKTLAGPLRALAGDGLGEDPVGLECVVALEGRRLVQDLMGAGPNWGLKH